MNKETLLKSLESQENLGQFMSFKSIPENLWDFDVALKWLETSVAFRWNGSDLALEAIPKHLINDDIRRAAVRLGVRALLHIHPDDTDIYLELVLQATAASSFGYIMIHESFQTAETLAAIIDHNPRYISMEWNGHQWMKPFLTQAMIDRVGAISYPFAMSVGIRNVAWSSVKEMLVNNPERYPDLTRCGGADLIVKMIQEGGWPAKIDGEFNFKPKGLVLLAGLLMKTEEDSAKRYLYRAYLQTFPIDKVFKVMSAPDRRKLLMEIYPPEALVGLAKDDRNFRGALLEDALGL
jgi:hypothetical protein